MCFKCSGIFNEFRSVRVKDLKKNRPIFGEVTTYLEYFFDSHGVRCKLRYIVDVGTVRCVHRVAQKRGHFIGFTACNFRSSDENGTKFGTNQRYFILNITS